MSKPTESKLDRYADVLSAMEAEKKTLTEMQRWLKEEGVSVSLSTLSRYLESARQRRLQERLLDQIASGAQQAKDVEKSFGENPPPELETLIKLQRVILLQLSTQANANPDFLELIGNSFKAVMDSEKLKLKREQIDLDRRKIVLLEQKATAFDQAKGVLENKELSEEQRAQRMREVFGITK